MNVGSVGRPMTGTPKANYAIINFDNGTFSVEHREVEYDYKFAAELMKMRNFEGAADIANQIILPIVRHL